MQFYVTEISYLHWTVKFKANEFRLFSNDADLVLLNQSKFSNLTCDIHDCVLYVRIKMVIFNSMSILL